HRHTLSLHDALPIFAEVVRRADLRARIDVGEHCFQCRQVRMDVGDQSVPHHVPPDRWRTIATDDDGHISRNSEDCFTASDAASRSMRTKPWRGKKFSAVCVSRYTAEIPPFPTWLTRSIQARSTHPALTRRRSPPPASSHVRTPP